MCPTACLLNPLERIIHTHTAHTNLLKTKLNMSAHMRTGMCAIASHVLHCKGSTCLSFLTNKCSQTERQICVSLLDTYLVGVCTQFALAQTRERSQTTMMRDGHYSKWPNGKGSMCEPAHFDACLCASALGGCGLLGDVGSGPLQW